MNGWLPEEVICTIAAFPNLWLPFFTASDVVFSSMSHGSRGGVLCLVPHSGSVPPSGCFSVQAKSTISCITKSGVTCSPPLVLPRDGSPVLFHVFYCSVIGTSRHPTAQTVVLCGVLSAWNSLCLMSTAQTRTCTPPHPNLAVVLFSFD